jgi:nucleotide-binding universal stress UspA family protein
VLDLQGYAGTASPITFNGLVRQYDLRADAEQGDLQVNLVDKHHRHEQSHAIAQRLRPALEKIAARHGAKLKVVEVPPGPPVMSPLVAEVYGPDEAGRQQLAARLAKAFARRPTSSPSTPPARGRAARLPAVRRQRAESLGIPVAAIAQTVQPRSRAGTPPGCTTATANTRCRCGCSCRATPRSGWTRCWPCRCGSQRPDGAAVRTGAVERGVIDKPLFTKDLRP